MRFHVSAHILSTFFNIAVESINHIDFDQPVIFAPPFYFVCALD